MLIDLLAAWREQRWRSARLPTVMPRRREEHPPPGHPHNAVAQFWGHRTAVVPPLPFGLM